MATSSRQELERYLQQNNIRGAYLSLISNFGDDQDIIRDTYAYALNNNQPALEELILETFPDILTSDQEYLEEIWIFAQVYNRPDLAKIAEMYLNLLPWGRLLTVAIVEDNEDLIQVALDKSGLDDEYVLRDPLERSNFSLEDYLLALVAAYRTGNLEMINYLGALVGPEYQSMIERGEYYTLEYLPDGNVEYRQLFTSA
jgi:hypothetical protein